MSDKVENIVQAAMFIQGTQRELNEIKFHVDGITDESGDDKETVIKNILQHGLNCSEHKITIKGVGTFPIWSEVYEVLHEMMIQLNALRLLEPEPEHTVFKSITLEKSR